jgi:sporulation protein YlmC with PRC-barrel domain
MKAVVLDILLAGSLTMHSAAFAQTSPAPNPAPAPEAPTGPAPPVTTSPPPNPSAVTPAPLPAAPTRQMTVADLTDKDLTGANNDEVGDIERVVESTADKKQHLVLNRGGFLGLFEAEVMIPLENVAAKGDQIVLRNLSQEQLKALPKFDSNDTAYRRLEDNQSVTLAEEK